MCHVGASISGQNVVTTTEILMLGSMWLNDAFALKMEGILLFREGLFGVKKLN
jgi:hypothetical protein